MWFSTLSRLVLSTLNLIGLGSVLAVGLIVVIQSDAADETTPDDYPGHLVLLPGEAGLAIISALQVYLILLLPAMAALL